MNANTIAKTEQQFCVHFPDEWRDYAKHH